MDREQIRRHRVAPMWRVVVVPPPMRYALHGAIMAANLPSSPRAVEVSVYVVREQTITNGDMAQRLAELEDKSEALA